MADGYPGTFADEQGRVFYLANLLEVGGYKSGHYVTTYQSLNPNIGDVFQYLGSGNAGFAPFGGGQPVPVTQGGTGRTSFVQNSVLIGEGSNPIGMTSVNASGTRMFLEQDSSGAPTWSVLQAGDIPNNNANTTGNSTTSTTATNVTNVTVANIVGAVAPGASGNVMTSTGTSWISAPPAGGVTLPITVSEGGTGSTGPAQLGDIFIGAGAGLPMTLLPAGATDTVLTSNGVGVAPSYKPVPGAGFPILVSQGGTGLTSMNNNSIPLGQGTSNMAFLPTGNADQLLQATGGGGPPQWRTPAGFVSTILHQQIGTTLNPVAGQVLDSFAVSNLGNASTLRIYVAFDNGGSTPSNTKLITSTSTDLIMQSSTDVQGGFITDVTTRAILTNAFQAYSIDLNNGVDIKTGFLGAPWAAPGFTLQLCEGDVPVDPGFTLHWTWTVVQMC